MNTTTIRTKAARPVPSAERSRARERTASNQLTGARSTYEPILRSSQAGGLCALMDELRRLGTLRPNHRTAVAGCSSVRLEQSPRPPRNDRDLIETAPL